MRTRHIKASCLLAMVLLAFTTVLFAQNGVIVTGTIIRSNGAPAVNVYVSIAGVGRYTDVGGRYKLDGVPQGRQRMRIEYQGGVLLDTSVEVDGRGRPVAIIPDQMIP
jgi:hypothetical protein